MILDETSSEPTHPPGAGGAWKLFVAVIPDAATVRVFENQQQRLRMELDRFHAREAAAWTPSSQFHLTLEFLGNVDSGRVESICRALETVAQVSEPFETGLTGLGSFPVFRQPRVLWAGVEAHPGLILLKKKIRAALDGIVPLDPVDSYFPHVTLARVKARSQIDGNLLRGILERLRGEQGGDGSMWKVRSLTLLKSVQTSSGVRHQTLSASRLAGL